MFKRTILVILTFFTINANAAVIQFDEEVDGDLYWNYEYIGIFDVGINTIAGHAGATRNPDYSITVDHDKPRFRIDEGFQITNINLTISNLVEGGANGSIGASLGLYWPSYNYLDSVQFTTDEIFSNGGSISIDLFNDSIPLFQEDYALSIGANGGAPLDLEFDYIWSVDVSHITTVPVPASVWLLGSGLIGLYGFARRNKSIGSIKKF